VVVNDIFYSDLMVKSLKERKQSQSLAEMAADGIGQNKKRAKKRDEERKAPFVRVPDKTVMVLHNKAIEVSRNQATFHLDRRAKPVDLFLKIVSEELLVEMIQHSYKFYCTQDDIILLNVHEALRYFATSLAIMWAERQFKLKTGEATRRARELTGLNIQGYNQYIYYKRLCVLVPELCEGTLSDNLTKLITPLGLLILDERKVPYNGHASCVKMVRGKPVLWQSQVAVKVPDSHFPFVYRMKCLTGGDESKKALAKWAWKNTASGTICVHDSFYTTNETLDLHETNGRLYGAACNEQFFMTESVMAKRYLVDEGDYDVIVKLNKEEKKQLDKKIAKGPAEEDPNVTRVSHLITGADSGHLRSFASHWHQQRNKRSSAVRTVVTNAFKPTARLNNHRLDISDIASTYASIYGAGSDDFNAVLAAINAGFVTKRRPHGHLGVFHHLTLLTVVCNMWTLMQHIGQFNEYDEGDKFGMKQFDALLFQLASQLLQHADAVSAVPVLKNLNECSCWLCQKSEHRTPFEHMLATSELHHEVQRKRQAKAMEKNERDQKKEAAAERKRVRWPPRGNVRSARSPYKGIRSSVAMETKTIGFALNVMACVDVR
jgi:hypothetical protein